MKQLFFMLLFFLLQPVWGQEKSYPGHYAREPRFRALVLYDPHAEEAHVQFDEQALNFFRKLSYGEGWHMTTATSLEEYTQRLEEFDVVIWLNFAPRSAKQRQAFEQYMENGGGWMGFHATAYNDQNTRWPWYNQFLGCGTFLANQWPPQCALLDCDTNEHPVTRTLPSAFVAAPSEYYMWQPSPRQNPDVDVLLSLSPKNYPFGIKDVITHGDFPVVWTNRKYRMIYLNMGHGDETFINSTEQLLFTNAFRWIVRDKLPK